MIKKLIFLFLMSVTGTTVFAIPQNVQRIYVRNHTGKTVIINRELMMTDKNDVDFLYTWKQDISGGKYDLFLTLGELRTDGRRLAPNKIGDIITYYPWPTASFSFEGESWESNEKLWERFDQIPFMEKMNTIFKSLRIATEDESKVITLENLGEQVITKSGRNYIIEIFD